MDSIRGFHANHLHRPRFFVTSLLIPALPAAAWAAVDPVIRCPDWRLHAPAVQLAAASAGQSRKDFESRLVPSGGTAAAPDPQEPAEPAAAGCPGHRVRPGETLSGIAASRLGDPRRWGEIADANGGVDPARLRAGAVLRIPCGPSAETAGAGQADGAGEEASGGGDEDTVRKRGGGFLRRLFGGGRRQAAPPQAEGSDGAGQADGTERADGTEAAPAAPPPPPLPVWKARRGEFFADVLSRWGEKAGYTVIADSAEAWRLGVPVRIQADFEAAVAELVRGLGHGGTSPRVRIYPNRVVRLGGPV